MTRAKPVPRWLSLAVAVEFAILAALVASEGHVGWTVVCVGVALLYAWAWWMYPAYRRWYEANEHGRDA